MRDFKSVKKTVEGNEGGKCKHRTRLDTYGCGCAHDCSYCYAKSLLDFRGLWNPDKPAVGDMAKISRQIRKLPCEVVRLGGMTDCFQPAEQLYKITYKTMRLLNRRRVPYLIVTKSARAIGAYSNKTMSIYAAAMGYNVIQSGSYHNVIDRAALVMQRDNI